jgi:hypothetical protein
MNNKGREMRLRPRRLSRWHLAIKALGERRRPVAVRRTEALRQLTDITVSKEYHHLLPHSSYINPKPALNSPSTGTKRTQLECPVPDPAAATHLPMHRRSNGSPRSNAGHTESSPAVAVAQGKDAPLKAN